MARVRWSDRAADDLEAIFTYIARDSGYYARRVVLKIMGLVDQIGELPNSGGIVPEYDDDRLRERTYQNYRVVYRIDGDVVVVLAIRHGARLLRDIE